MMKSHTGLRRRPFMTPLWLAAVMALAAFSAAVVVSFALWLWGTAPATTVIVIRHAERAAGELADPPLSDAGRARAALLARMFGDEADAGRVDAIYVSATARSRMTAAPLAARLGLTPSVGSADPRTLARRVLREHAGGRILIVGHADTIPELVSILSGVPPPAPIAAGDFGTMFIVLVPRVGRSNLLRLRY
jgi:broad specificity phosphatase PhoE